ncbi:MAG: DegQ family serine endoprotease [Sphingomonadales bacterium]|nr:DegQ family serine endoprotease [Sphingomonadales bacterium]
MKLGKIKIAFGFLLALVPLASVGFTQAQQGVDRVVPESNMQVMLSFAPLVEDVAPAVVNIYTTRVVQINRSPLFDDPFFQRFFGGNNPFSIPRERVQGSLGSGVILRKNGIIVTNNHVIGEADSIRVVLADRREYEAEVILADERTDLAVLKIDTEGENLPFIPLLDSDTVKVGDVVIAIGNPFGVGQTVTSGIVSATARTQVGISNFQFFIQTDAAVNPGNSGGALVGLDGNLIGINTAIYSRAGENNGISFAIPANMVRSVVGAALSDGEIIRPWLGATGQVVSSDIAASLGLSRPGGVIVDNVYANGPADEAGILPSDVIIAVNGREVIDPQGLSFRVATADVNSRVPFTVLRGGDTLNIAVTLTPPPENPPRNITLLDGRHPFQGVKIANLSPKYADELGLAQLMSGVIVIEVDRRSPAARRQLVRPGDIILSLNGQDITSVSDVELMLVEPVNDYSYRLNRRGRQIECAIVGLRSFSCRQ